MSFLRKSFPGVEAQDDIRPLLCSGLLALILLLGVFFRVYRIESASLWLDELGSSFRYLETPDLATHVAMVHSVAVEVAPAFATVQYLISRLIGNDPTHLRYVSVFFGSCSILVLFAVGRLLFNRNAGLLAAAFLACSPVHIFFSQNLRPQALLIFLVLLSILFFLKGASSDWRWWLPALVINAAITLTHYTYALLPCTEALVALLLALRGKRTGWFFLALQFLFMIPFLLYVPNLLSSYHLGMKFSFVPLFLFECLTSSTISDELFGVATPFWGSHLPASMQEAIARLNDYTVSFLDFLFLVSMVWYFAWYGRKTSKEQIIFAGCVIFVPAVVLASATYFKQIPIMMPRYLIYGLTMRMAIGAGFLSMLRPSWVKKMGIGVVLAVLSYQVLYFVPNRYRMDFLGVAEYVEKNGTPGEALMSVSFAEAMTLENCNEKRPHFPVLWVFNFNSIAETAHALLTRTSPPAMNRVWFVHSLDAGQQPPEPLEAALHNLGLEFDRRPFPGRLGLLLYEIRKRNGSPPTAPAPQAEQVHAFLERCGGIQSLQLERLSPETRARYEQLLYYLLPDSAMAPDFMPQVNVRFIPFALAMRNELDLAERTVPLSALPFMGGQDFAQAIIRSLAGDQTEAQRLFDSMPITLLRPAFLMEWLRLFALDRNYAGAFTAAKRLESYGFSGAPMLCTLSRHFAEPTSPIPPIGVVPLQLQDTDSVFGHGSNQP